jgi:TetR/AcrR family transcriptional regulator, mexJK operon transcriptional repressor
MTSPSVAPVLRIRDRAPAAPQQARSIEKRQKLLDAGRALFAEKGYEAASIGEITSRARTASGGFYQFFSSKRQFLVVLMNDFLARLAALNLRPQAAGGDLRESLSKFLADAFRVDHACFGVVRAWQEAVGSDAELAQLEKEIEAWTNARVLGVFQLLSKHPRARPGADLPAFARMMNRHFWSLLARGSRLSPREFAHEVHLSADVIYNYLFSDSPR